MIMNSICCGSFCGIIILIIVYGIQFNKKIKNLEQIVKIPPPILNYNFEEDIKFLKFLISQKVSNVKNFSLDTLQYKYSTKVNPEDIKTEVVESLVIEIMITLSDNYKNLLYKYFTEKSLIEYVTEIVNNEVIAIMLAKTVRSVKKSNDMIIKK